MKATYQDFLTENNNCIKFESNLDAIGIFNLLNEDENIIKMVELSDAGKPALAACVNQVEEYFNCLSNPAIDLNDGFTRTVVGRMVKAVLAPFGYRPTAQKGMPASCKSKYFSSASCYSLTGPATMRVVKRVEVID